MLNSRAPVGAAEARDLQMFITPDEFASIVRLSRRQIDRLRKRRPPGFPTEYELGSGLSKHGHCPRFKLADVLTWIETLALW